MKFSAIAPLAFVAILSAMVTISSAAPAVEPNNNCAVEADTNSVVEGGTNSAVEANNNPSSKCKCNMGCTKEYNPRCAKLGNGEYRTFGNPCMYEAYKCTHPKEKVKLISKTACPVPTPTCATTCTKEYDPVCAKLGNGEYRTFGNPCMYEAYKCTHPKEKVKLISKTACPVPTPPCATTCTKEYNPRCAKLGNGEYRTFGNPCMYEAYKCTHPKEKVKLISKTACPVPTPTCATTCTKEYDPVCAKLGNGKYQTFGNQCTYEVYMCEHPKEKTELISRTTCPKKAYTDLRKGLF